MQPREKMNDERGLRERDPSIWLDILDRDLLHSVELDRWIGGGGLHGVTSNPSRFEQALATGSTYDEDIRRAHHEETDAHVLERVMVRDAQVACDKFQSVNEASGGHEGFASIDLSPLVAHDTEGAVSEARRLWHKVGRKNLMVKIPATREGVATTFRCLSEGINVNATLVFSETRYLDIADAYLRALEGRCHRGEPLDAVSSVVSFFVSRVDARVDEALAALGGTTCHALRGQIGIANAKVVHEDCEYLHGGSRWKRLAAEGAKPQRLVWASTSPKDLPSPLPQGRGSPLRYVDALAGRGTVATMTPEAFRVYCELERGEERLAAGRDDAHGALASVHALGIDLRAIANELEHEGVHRFADSFRASLAHIKGKRRSLSAA
jgi:transaldolase